jgi:hypothetical protein
MLFGAVKIILIACSRCLDNITAQGWKFFFCWKAVIVLKKFNLNHHYEYGGLLCIIRKRQLNHESNQVQTQIFIRYPENIHKKSKGL